MALLRKHWLVLVAVVALALLARDAFEHRGALGDARRQTKEALQRAEVSDSLLTDAGRAARAALARGDSLARRADSLKARARAARVEYAFRADGAPVECDSIVAAADLAIAAADSVAAAEYDRAEGYRGQIEDIAMAIARSQEGFRDLTEAAKKLHAMSRPSLAQRLLPDEVGLVVLQNVGMTGPGASAGVVVSWHF